MQVAAGQTQIAGYRVVLTAEMLELMRTEQRRRHRHNHHQ
jgi:hypothetical protein